MKKYFFTLIALPLFFMTTQAFADTLGSYTLTNTSYAGSPNPLQYSIIVTSTASINDITNSGSSGLAQGPVFSIYSDSGYTNLISTTTYEYFSGSNTATWNLNTDINNIGTHTYYISENFSHIDANWNNGIATLEGVVGSGDSTSTSSSGATTTIDTPQGFFYDNSIFEDAISLIVWGVAAGILTSPFIRLVTNKRKRSKL